MAILAKQWLDIGEALVRPRQRHQNDLSTLADLNWSRQPEVLPEGIGLQWLGTAGFRIDCEGYSLLVDPYLSRVPLRSLVGRGYLEPANDEITRYIDAADAIVVGHTHFDHALDVPHIVKAHNCPVYGSPSLQHLMSLYGLQDRATVVECDRVYQLGPFEVTFEASLHSKLLLGLKVPSEGELCCEHLDNLGSGQYRCGQVYGIHIKVNGTTFYHQGSANLIEENIKHRGIDYFLAGIAGRGFTHDYCERILQRLEPRVIVPHHFDSFFQTADQPLSFILNVNLGRFVEEVRRVSDDFDIRTLDLMQRVG